VSKTIITVAPTGTLTPRGYNVPETPEEIAAATYELWQLGAAIVHLHMRDEDGRGTMDVERFRETIYRIRSYKDCDIIINCTSSGDPRVSAGDAAGNAIRMLHLRTLDGIELGTYDAGSFNWLPNMVFMNTPQFLDELGRVYLERGIKPEVEIFDAGMLGVVEHFIKQGSLKQPIHYQFCLGVGGAMPATVENLLYLLSHVPMGSTWSAFGVGKGHMSIMYAALALGGHIRVGMEDNIIYGVNDDGQKIIATNATLLGRAVRAVEAFGNTVATAADAREMLGIRPFDGDAVRARLGVR
jgi:3-keto-5-aminohexanoate cleavage enzyme